MVFGRQGCKAPGVLGSVVGNVSLGLLCLLLGQGALQKEDGPTASWPAVLSYQEVCVIFILHNIQLLLLLQYHH